MAEATGVREKQASDFAALKADNVANIGAVTKAIAAIEKGMGESFLQTDDADILKNFVAKKTEDMPDSDRDTLLIFLSEDSQYAPQGGEITGILKQMSDEMQKGLSDATVNEDKAISVYDELMAAKTKEVNALTKQIEVKTEKGGELAVQVAQISNDIEDTKESLAQDKKFLAELERSCKTKGAEWEERCKVRQEELVALSDTIKILNDDDALELFKKTLPGGASLLQVQVSGKVVRERARDILKKAAHKRPANVALAFVAQALHGKKIGFEKVVAMIDEMIGTLKTEQQDDDSGPVVIAGARFFSAMSMALPSRMSA